MKNVLLMGLLVFSTFTPKAFAKCPKPVEDSATAFKLIQNPSSGDFIQFFESHLIARTALNENCEDMYMLSLRHRNETVRLYLQKIGFGPKTKNDVNAWRDHVDLSYYEYAVRYSSMATIKALKQLGGEIIGFSDLYPRPSEYVVAAAYNKLDVVSEMLKTVANVDERSPAGAKGTALMYAVQANTLDVVKALIQAGADIEARDNQKLTPILYAAKFNSQDFIRTLVRAGADVYAVADSKCNALCFAANFNSSSEVIELLTSLGLDVNSRHSNGATPIVLAASTNSNPEVIQALINAGADIKDRYKDSSLLGVAAEFNRNVKVTQKLIGLGLSVNDFNQSGNTPLHLAASRNTKEVMTALLAAGADKNSRNTINKIPYDYAVTWQRGWEILELLKPIE